MKQNKTVQNFMDKVLPKLKNGLLLMVAAILLIVLVFVNQFSGKNEKPETGSETASTGEDFIKQTEDKLKAALEAVTGVGSCQVVVTLESGKENIYAVEEKSSSSNSTSGDKTQSSQDLQKSYKTIDGSKNESPVIIKELSPQIKGVAVICDGGGNNAIKNTITEIVSKLLGVSSDKIAIASKK